MGQIARIALVHDFLLTFGGAERVLQTLHNLFPEAPIYALLGNEYTSRKHFPNATVHYSYLQKHPFHNHPSWLLSSFPRAVESFDFNGYDLVISSSGAFSHGIITGPETKHICYCHSPMRYVWDWHSEYLQEKGLDSTFVQFFVQPKLHSLRLWDYYSSKRVDYWIANSSTVQARIKTYYQQESVIIYPPIDTEFFQAGLPYTTHKQPYAITCSRLTPNKRIDQIIEACAKAQLPLHIVGTGGQEGALRKVAEEKKTEVIWHGGVGEETKRDLLGNAACFLFAAEDDFGIAPVEALCMGIPVIAFGKGGATDYVNDGKNGYLYPEPTADSLYRHIMRFLSESVSHNSQEIRNGALRFDTSNFSKSIKKIVDDYTA